MREMPVGVHSNRGRIIGFRPADSFAAAGVVFVSPVSASTTLILLLLGIGDVDLLVDVGHARQVLQQHLAAFAVDIAEGEQSSAAEFVRADRPYFFGRVQTAPRGWNFIRCPHKTNHSPSDDRPLGWANEEKPFLIRILRQQAAVDNVPRGHCRVGGDFAFVERHLPNLVGPAIAM